MALLCPGVFSGPPLLLCPYINAVIIVLLQTGALCASTHLQPSPITSTFHHAAVTVPVSVHCFHPPWPHPSFLLVCPSHPIWPSTQLPHVLSAALLYSVWVAAQHTSPCCYCHLRPYWSCVPSGYSLVWSDNLTKVKCVKPATQGEYREQLRMSLGGGAGHATVTHHQASV